MPASAAQDNAVVTWHANAHSMLGGLAQQRGELQQALGHFEDSIAVLQRALAPKQALVGQLHQTVGMPSLGQGDTALRWMTEAATIYDALIARENLAADRMHRAMLDGGQAVVHQRHDRLAESLACLQQAQSALATLTQDTQGLDTGVVHGHAMVLNNLSFVQGRLGLHADALASAALSFQRTEQLREHDATNPAWRQRWAIFGQGYAGSLIEAGRHAEALALLQRIEPVWPDERNAAASLAEQRIAGRREAVNQRDQGRCLLALGRAETAVPLILAAQAALAALLQAAPEDRDLLLLQAQTHAVAAQAEPSRAESWRASARLLYDEAGRMQPLSDDHLRARLPLD